MESNVYKNLLRDFGCLDDGQFVCPSGLSKFTVTVSGQGEGVHMVVRHKAKAAGKWSYNQDFIVFEDGRGRAVYFAWSGVASVTFNTM